MSTAIQAVDLDESLETAAEIMQQHAIHHLPVLQYGKLVGLLSARDLYLVLSVPASDPVVVGVRQAMTEDLYTVDPEADLKEVAREMARRKIGSTVVVEGRRVVGVFTTVDALRALVDALQ